MCIGRDPKGRKRASGHADSHSPHANHTGDLADDDTSNLRGRIAVLEARKQTLGTAFTIADQSTLNELIATLDEKSGGKAALNSRAVVQQMVVTPEIVDGMNAAIKVVKPQLQPLLALGGVELNQAQLFDLFESVCDLDPEKSDTPANNDDEASKDGDTDDASTGGSSSDAGPAPSKRVKRLVEQIANAHILTAKDIKTELSREALYTADNFRVKHSSRDSITKVVLFFLLGAAVFMPSESRPCDLEAPLAAYSNASEAQCGWTIIDTFYFSICMLTIDQQPFFEPTWWLTQAFLVPYFSIGILYIWPILRKLCGELPRLIRKIWYHASHYLSGGRSKWLLRKFHEKVTKRLHNLSPSRHFLRYALHAIVHSPLPLAGEGAALPRSPVEREGTPTTAGRGAQGGALLRREDREAPGRLRPGDPSHCRHPAPRRSQGAPIHWTRQGQVRSAVRGCGAPIW